MRCILQRISFTNADSDDNSADGENREAMDAILERSVRSSLHGRVLCGSLTEDSNSVLHLPVNP